MELLVKVTARLLQKGLGKPFSGEEFSFRLYDQDLMKDDFLGEASPDEEGRVEITFHPASIRTTDSPDETEPDLYFVLLKNGQAIYQSEVINDVNFDREGDFSSREGVSYDMGTFVI